MILEIADATDYIHSDDNYSLKKQEERIWFCSYNYSQAYLAPRANVFLFVSIADHENQDCDDCLKICDALGSKEHQTLESNHGNVNLATK